MNREQKRKKAKQPVYNPVNTDKLSMQKEIKEKLSLATLIQLEKEFTEITKRTVDESLIPTAERIHKMDWAVVFRVLIDRFGFDKYKIKELFDLCNSYLEDVEAGMLNLDEMCNTLINDDDIEIEWHIDPERI